MVKNHRQNENILGLIQRYIRSPIFLILSFSVVIIILGLVGEFVGGSLVVATDWAPTLVMAALTLGLLLVYQDIAQTEEEKEQRLKNRHSAFLVVQGVGFRTPQERGVKKGDEFYLELDVKNLGDIPARAIEFIVKPDLMRWNSQERRLERLGDCGLGNIETMAMSVDETSSREDLILDTHAFLDGGNEKRFKIYMDFPVLDSDQGYFSPNGTLDKTISIRPYEMTYGASKIEANPDHTGLVDQYYTNNDTLLNMEDEDGVQAIPFHRLRLSISARYILKYDSDGDRMLEEEQLISLILPLHQISDTLPVGEDIPDEMWRWGSREIWPNVMEETEYHNAQHHEILSQYSSDSYDNRLDPIENRIKNNNGFQPLE